MPIELLLLLLAWAVTFSLIVILPWAVIRLTVGLLEADVSKRGSEHGHAQPRQLPDTEAVNALSREPDTVEPVDPLPATPPSDEDATR